MEEIMRDEEKNCKSSLLELKGSFQKLVVNSIRLGKDLVQMGDLKLVLVFFFQLIRILIF